MSAHDRRDVVRAVRRLLIDNWDATNTAGVAPQETAGSGTDSTPTVLIHTGSTSDRIEDPQIAVEAASNTPTVSQGYAAYKADGTGFVAKYDGVLDIRCVGGSDETSGDTHPRHLSQLFADEVREIAHAAATITNPTTGDLEYRSVSPGLRRGPIPDQYRDGRWHAIQEIRYSEADEPPDR